MPFSQYHPLLFSTHCRCDKLKCTTHFELNVVEVPPRDYLVFLQEWFKMTEQRINKKYSTILQRCDVREKLRGNIMYGLLEEVHMAEQICFWASTFGLLIRSTGLLPAEF